MSLKVLLGAASWLVVMHVLRGFQISTTHGTSMTDLFMRYDAQVLHEGDANPDIRVSNANVVHVPSDTTTSRD